MRSRAMISVTMLIVRYVSCLALRIFRWFIHYFRIKRAV